jgi:CarboxypepD_reg-like domain
MTTLHKPKYCGQDWLDMTPTGGGRICGQCNKTIIDFSKMTWADIQKIQLQNSNSVCGMYKPRQLEYWGQEIPNHSNSIVKVAAITGLTLSLSSSVYSQTAQVKDSLIIRGKVIDKKTNEELSFANVFLKSSKQVTTADIEGNFKIVVKDIPASVYPDTLVVQYVGYLTTQLVFKDLHKIKTDSIGMQSGELNLKLELQSGPVIAFYVTKPTLRQKIKWRFKKWFGRKDK